MDFREYTVTRDGSEILVEGTIREPVRWDFSIRMCEDDLAGIAGVAMSRKTLGFLIRAMFKRKKDSHWSVDRETHLVQVKEAITARAEAVAKKAAQEEAKKAAQTEAAAQTETEAPAESESSAERASLVGSPVSVEAAHGGAA